MRLKYRAEVSIMHEYTQAHTYIHISIYQSDLTESILSTCIHVNQRANTMHCMQQIPTNTRHIYTYIETYICVRHSVYVCMCGQGRFDIANSVHTHVQNDEQYAMDVCLVLDLYSISMHACMHACMGRMRKKKRQVLLCVHAPLYKCLDVVHGAWHDTKRLSKFIWEKRPGCWCTCCPLFFAQKRNSLSFLLTMLLIFLSSLDIAGMHDEDTFGCLNLVCHVKLGGSMTGKEGASQSFVLRYVSSFRNTHRRFYRNWFPFFRCGNGMKTAWRFDRSSLMGATDDLGAVDVCWDVFLLVTEENRDWGCCYLLYLPYRVPAIRA